MSAGWGSSLRLAWREARRRPGRTALVMVVVGLPVAALAAGLMVLRTVTVSPEEARAANYGRADEVVAIGMETSDTWSAPSEVPGPGRAEARDALLAALPPGSRVVSAVLVADAVTRADGHLMRVGVSDEPLDDPLLAGRATLVEGRAPRGAGEAAVTATVMRRTGADLGDRIDLLASDDVVVTGVFTLPTGRHVETGVIVGEPLIPPAEGWGNRQPTTSFFVDLPAGATGPLPELPPAFGSWWPPFDDSDTARDLRTQIGAGYALAAVGLLITGTVVAAAFAVGARRHLRMLGLLDASGVPPSGLRRTMVLQGTVTGGLAAGVGLALALVAGQAAEPHLDRLADGAVGPLVVHPLDLAGPALLGVAAASLAAWFPARSASRVPTLAALAGRRPVGRPRLSWPPIGALTAGAGALAVGTYGARPYDVPWGLALGGAVLVLAGGALCTPWLVARFEPLAGRLRGAPRLAARGLARNRLRTCAVATAIMAPAAAATFGLTISASDRAGAEHWSPVRPDQLLVSDFGDGDDPNMVPSDEAMAPIRAAVPGAVEAPLVLLVDPSQPLPTSLVVEWDADPGDELAMSGGSAVAVASPELLDALAAPQDTAELVDDDVTVVSLQPVPDDLEARVAAWSQPDPSRDVLFDRGQVVVVDGGERAPTTLPQFVVSPGWARDHGFGTVESGLLLRAPAPLTADQRRLAFQPFGPDDEDDWIRHEILGTPAPEHGLSVTVDSPPPDDRAVTAAVAGAVLVFTLLVMAVTLALNAAETRDERRLLAALGAPPRLQRSTAAWESFLLPWVGLVIGVPLGVACAASVVLLRERADDDMTPGVRLVLPWLLVGVLVVGVPLVSGLVTRGAASLAGRRRASVADGLAWD